MAVFAFWFFVMLLIWLYLLGLALVAALAHGSGALVWSLDADFERMARLKFIGLYA